jgi:hypothetical protein
VIVALHVGGALCHRIVKYDGVLARMWPGGQMRSSCSQLQNNSPCTLPVDFDCATQ